MRPSIAEWIQSAGAAEFREALEALGEELDARQLHDPAGRCRDAAASIAQLTIGKVYDREEVNRVR